jgi:hypothetical protein
MTTIVTRAGKGDTLSWVEVDTNFTNLNTDKLEHIVSDTTPQLGGSLDVNGQSIVSVSNGNITLAPNGTGRVSLDGVLWPAADGTNGQILTTNGSGSASWATPSAGGSASYAILIGPADLTVSNIASNSNIFGAGQLTEEYDPSGIVSVNGDADIVLATAGTYIYQVSSVPLYATNYGPGSSSTALTSPTAYFNIFNTTTSTQLASQDLDQARHPGNASSITYRANLGQIDISVRIVTTTSNNVIRLRVTGASASSGGSNMVFGGNRTITFVVTKVA